MSDAEVFRLRRLRDVALRVRALVHALHFDDDELAAQSAVVCWRIASVATGRLRAHPYVRYQQQHGFLKSLLDRTVSSLKAQAARQQGRRLHVLASELNRLARELQDARALTSAPELSDTLGRAQAQLRRIAAEVVPGTEAIRSPLLSVERTPPGGDWPYIAI